MEVKNFICIFIVFITTDFFSQSVYTKQDSLRGSITSERSWWDVKKYDLEIEPIFNKQKVIGVNKITFFTLWPGQKMQLDLQEPMEIDSVSFAEEKTTLSRLGKIYYIHFENELFEVKMF